MRNGRDRGTKRNGRDGGEMEEMEEKRERRRRNGRDGEGFRIEQQRYLHGIHPDCVESRLRPANVWTVYFYAKFSSNFFDGLTTLLPSALFQG